MKKNRKRMGQAAVTSPRTLLELLANSDAQMLVIYRTVGRMWEELCDDRGFLRYALTHAELKTHGKKFR